MGHPDQRAYAKQRDCFVNTDQLHLTLREIRTLLSNPRVLVALIGAAILATVAQPFGFRVEGHIGLTLIYWIILVFVTFPVGHVISTTCANGLSARHTAIAPLCAALAMGLFVTVFVLILNSVFLSWPFGELRYWAILLTTAFPAAAITTVVIYIVSSGQNVPQPKEVQAPALLSKIPANLRGPILSLSAEDHYTRVVTTKGAELVLIRLSDAITQAAPTRGLQVHRSHWVAIAAIAQVAKQKDGAIITLKSGTTLPVSRSHVAAVRNEGFL